MYELAEIMRQQDREFAEEGLRSFISKPNDTCRHGTIQRTRTRTWIKKLQTEQSIFATNPRVDAFNDRIITTLQPAAPDSIAIDGFIGGRVAARTREAVLATVRIYTINDTFSWTSNYVKVAFKHSLHGTTNSEDDLVNVMALLANFVKSISMFKTVRRFFSGYSLSIQ